jgi:hypothetical protein
MSERDRRLRCLASLFAFLPITETFLMLVLLAAQHEPSPEISTADNGSIVWELPSSFDYPQPTGMLLT